MDLELQNSAWWLWKKGDGFEKLGHDSRLFPFNVFFPLMKDRSFTDQISNFSASKKGVWTIPLFWGGYFEIRAFLYRLITIVCFIERFEFEADYKIIENTFDFYYSFYIPPRPPNFFPKGPLKPATIQSIRSLSAFYTHLLL